MTVQNTPWVLDVVDFDLAVSRWIALSWARMLQMIQMVLTVLIAQSLLKYPMIAGEPPFAPTLHYID